MIDFNELLVMIAVTSRLNNVDSRLALLFDSLVINKTLFILFVICIDFPSWDQTNDGQIDQKELTLVISAIVSFIGCFEL